MKTQEYDTLPQHVQDILYLWDDNNPNPYDECRKTITMLNNVGWTADYGLDGMVYDVKNLNVC